METTKEDVLDFFIQNPGTHDRTEMMDSLWDSDLAGLVDLANELTKEGQLRYTPGKPGHGGYWEYVWSPK